MRRETKAKLALETQLINSYFGFSLMSYTVLASLRSQFKETLKKKNKNTFSPINSILVLPEIDPAIK